jgi:hypothetical protein
MSGALRELVMDHDLSLCHREALERKRTSSVRGWRSAREEEGRLSRWLRDGGGAPDVCGLRRTPAGPGVGSGSPPVIFGVASSGL